MSIKINEIIREICNEATDFDKKYKTMELSDRGLKNAYSELEDTTRLRTDNPELLAQETLKDGIKPIGSGQKAYNVLGLALRYCSSNLIIKTDTGADSLKALVKPGDYKFGKSCFAFRYNLSGYKNSKAGKWTAGRREIENVIKIYPGEIAYAAQLTLFGKNAFLLMLNNELCKYMLLMEGGPDASYQRSLYYNAFDYLIYNM